MTADNTNDRLQDLQRFDELLLVYGADQDRWSASDRVWATDLLAAVPAALQKLEEARALDQVLDLAAHTTPTQHSALVDRIVSAATASAQIGQTGQSQLRQSRPDLEQVEGAEIIPFAKVQTPVRPARIAPTASHGTVWQAAAALVAALALGVVLGVSDFGRPTVREFVVAAGMASDQDQEYSLLDVSPLSPSDEELQ